VTASRSACPAARTKSGCGRRRDRATWPATAKTRRAAPSRAPRSPAQDRRSAKSPGGRARRRCARRRKPPWTAAAASAPRPRASRIGSAAVPGEALRLPRQARRAASARSGRAGMPSIPRAVPTRNGVHRGIACGTGVAPGPGPPARGRGASAADPSAAGASGGRRGGAAVVLTGGAASCGGAADDCGADPSMRTTTSRPRSRRPWTIWSMSPGRSDGRTRTVMGGAPPGCAPAGTGARARSAAARARRWVMTGQRRSLLRPPSVNRNAGPGKAGRLGAARA
jgi:hypothetical protein